MAAGTLAGLVVPEPVLGWLAHSIVTEEHRDAGAPSRLFRLERPGGDRHVLKVAADLGGEAARLRWLGTQDLGGLAVPAVLGFVGTRERDFLLMTRLDGIDAGDPRILPDAEAIVVGIGRALRALHRLPVEDCPFSAGIDALLAVAERRVATGMVRKDHFPPCYLSRSPAELLEILDDLRPRAAPATFTHGDPSLVNFLFRDRSVVGCVDVGLAGISDPYRDLAITMRSIGYNLGRRWNDVFLDAYGTTLDRDRYAFFLILDRFVMTR